MAYGISEDARLFDRKVEEEIQEEIGKTMMEMDEFIANLTKENERLKIQGRLEKAIAVGARKMRMQMEEQIETLMEDNRRLKIQGKWKERAEEGTTECRWCESLPG